MGSYQKCNTVGILLCCTKGFGIIDLENRSSRYLVTEPSWIENLFGITFEKKIAKYTKKLQKICNEHNNLDSNINALKNN